jgi:myo-inositol 2-dehydrogenase/D-chiro-inositol 1-dehydrogenase
MTHVRQRPVRIGLIGAGRIGTHHADALVRHVPTAELVLVADSFGESAVRLGEVVGVPATDEVERVLEDESVEAVMITAASTAHSELVQRSARAGKAVFCEKPMAMSLAEADAAIAACEEAGVPLQVGFNRRFADDFIAAKDVIAKGEIGTPQLLRSLTRDPGLANPGAVPPWTIFTQTLIHDFDTLLWLNAGAAAVEVHAFADALIAPEFKESGLLDTAVVTIRFDNGAIATAEASFSAAYGYDVRGEVFGSAGMVTAGNPAQLSMQHWTSNGVSRRTERRDTDLLHSAYVGEFTAFCEVVRDQSPVAVGGSDARAAFQVALAAIASVERGGSVRIDDITVGVA